MIKRCPTNQPTTLSGDAYRINEAQKLIAKETAILITNHTTNPDNGMAPARVLARAGFPGITGQPVLKG